MGDYDLVNVFANRQLAVSGSSHILPPDLLDVVRITPIYLVRFDDQDVIHTITETDVVIRAQVGTDGHVFEPVVQFSERPELNQEALALARQWTFTPALCNGRPNMQEVDFTLHFRGR